jgi:hypothetical protein
MNKGKLLDTPRPCEKCGVDFQPNARDVRRGYGRFCSRSCQASRPKRPASEALWAKVDKTGECWLFTGARLPRGYGMISAEGRRVYAHRLSYELNIGSIPAGMFVCHRCDNPSCVRPEHLFLGTHHENMADMTAKGRQARGNTHGSRLRPETNHSPKKKLNAARGERSGKAKLTEAQVVAIRSAYATGGTSQLRLAKEHGVAESLIWAIVHRRIWAHVA